MISYLRFLWLKGIGDLAAVFGKECVKSVKVVAVRDTPGERIVGPSLYYHSGAVTPGCDGDSAERFLLERKCGAYRSSHSAPQCSL